MRSISRRRALGGGGAVIGLVVSVALMVGLFVIQAAVSIAQTTDGDHDKISVVKVALQGNREVSSASIREGDTASFKIVVTTQPFPIDGVVLTDVLPAGVASWTVTGADAVAAGCGGTYAGGATLTCNFGHLGDFGVVVTKTVFVSGATADPACGGITNTARVTVATSEGETKLLNNVSTASIAVSCGNRMTGGGSIILADGTRVTHCFELHCSRNDVPNNLEINWGGGNNFHLGSLTSVRCSDDPLIAPPPPHAGFDTYVGEGTGTCNGLAASITFRLTDAGEPGTSDTAQYTITGGCSLNTPILPLTFGNQQAH